MCRPAGFSVEVPLLAGTHALAMLYADGGWGDRAIVTYSGPDTHGEARGIPAGAPAQAARVGSRTAQLGLLPSPSPGDDLLDGLLDEEGDDDEDGDEDDDEDGAFPEPPAFTPSSGHSQTAHDAAASVAVSEERIDPDRIVVPSALGGGAVCALLLLLAAIKAAMARRRPREKTDDAAAAAAKVAPADIENAGDSAVAGEQV